MRNVARLVFGTVLLVTLASVATAGNYALDAAHTAVTFKISHLGISTTVGRFNDVAGEFTFDKEAPEKAAFSLTIKTESVDTGNKQRDDHLRSPDFFNAKQFPTITFKSKSVKKSAEGYVVEGDLTLHGVTKAITLVLKGGNGAEFPKGVQRVGFSTESSLHRSEYEMKGLLPAVGDDVSLFISFEGTAK
jgi:polyisoprenoid-binding protein YceI